MTFREWTKWEYELQQAGEFEGKAECVKAIYIKSKERREARSEAPFSNHPCNFLGIIFRFNVQEQKPFAR